MPGPGRRPARPGGGTVPRGMMPVTDCNKIEHDGPIRRDTHGNGVPQSDPARDGARHFHGSGRARLGGAASHRFADTFAMSRPMTHPGAALTVDYVQASAPDALLTADTLAVFGFGTDAPHCGDPRYLRVPLQPYGTAPFEHWRSAGPVDYGAQGDARTGQIRWSSDGQLTFGVIEIDEPPGEHPDHSDIC